VDPRRRASGVGMLGRVTRRPLLAVAALVTVAAGLTVRSVGDGAVSQVAGDALYAVLVYVLVGFLAVRARPAAAGGLAWAVCAVVELAQLTGVPAAVVEVWDPARWVLGTTFHAPDLLVYAVGAACAVLVDVLVSGRLRGRLDGRAAGQRDAWESEPPPEARRSTR
jgi:hypothetical protein